MNYILEVSYNGSNYYGWAIQPNLKTVNGTLHEIIKFLFNDEFIVYSSSRTDKGVHAIQQVINLKFQTLTIEPEILMKAINSRLPYDIRIKKCIIVKTSFNIQNNVKEKTYRYFINTNINFDPIFQTNFYQYNKQIDIEKINSIKHLFLGKKNFLSFSTSEFKSKDCIRNIFAMNIFKNHDYVIFEIKGDGFLRNMVRMIIGTLLAFNEDKINIDDINDCFVNPKKGKSKFKVPACGLYLYRVKYEN